MNLKEKLKEYYDDFTQTYEISALFIICAFGLLITFAFIAVDYQWKNKSLASELQQMCFYNCNIKEGYYYSSHNFNCTCEGKNRNSIDAIIKPTVSPVNYSR